MANPLDIVYSRKNADGTGFNEKILVPIPNYFIVCDDCGDLTTSTGSFSVMGSNIDGGHANSVYGGTSPLDGGNA